MRGDALLHGSSAKTNGFVASSHKNIRLISVVFLNVLPPTKSAMSKLWQIIKSNSLAIEYEMKLLISRINNTLNFRKVLRKYGLSYYNRSMRIDKGKKLLRSRVVGQLAWLITKIHAGSIPASAIKIMVVEYNNEIKNPHRNLNSFNNQKKSFCLLLRIKKPLFIYRSGF